MPVNYENVNTSTNRSRPVNYQPDYPLIYSPIRGPYESITSKEESIQKDFENLLLTNPGEWPMNPDLGVGLKRYLFENYGSPELGKIEQRIKTQLERHLPFPYIGFISAKFIYTEEDQDHGFATLQIRYVINGNLVRLLELDRDRKIKIKNLGAFRGADPNDVEKIKSLTSNLRNI